jgi:hypothetical protein
MARQKRVAVQRTPSELYFQTNGEVHIDNTAENGSVVENKNSVTVASLKLPTLVESQPGLGSLILCVGGIYASL